MEVSERRELGAHAAAWDELVLQRPLPSPFLRSWWIGAAARGEPVVVLCLDGDDLVGGLALQRRRRLGVEWLEMLGDGPLEPDHLDLVARHDRVPEVRDALVAWLSRGGSRCLSLRGLVPGGDLMGALPGRGWAVEVPPAPYIELPRDVDTLLARVDGRLRSTITRSGRRLDKAGVTTRVRVPGEVDEALAVLQQLHDDRWGAHSGFLTAWDDFVRVARAGAPTGEVRFTELVDGSGRVVATEVDFVVAGRVSFYQAGRLDERELRGSGSVLKARVLEHAIAEGCREYDLLRGDEPYKAQWTDLRRSLGGARRGVGPAGLAVTAIAEANREVVARLQAAARRREARRRGGGVA